MSYPSIITQQGAAERNTSPIIQALSTLIKDDEKGQVIEFGSGSYIHIEQFARKWENVRWWGTVRDEDEQRIVSSRLEKENIRLPNLNEPRLLDISDETHWNGLLRAVKYGTVGPFTGAILINIIHCCPLDFPENVFKHLSPIRSSYNPQPLDTSKGWIIAYGPWLNDDGSYKSEGDEKFDKEYIKSKSPLLGLRSIKSISDIAFKYGFIEEDRMELPKGNIFVVWRVQRL